MRRLSDLTEKSIVKRLPEEAYRILDLLDEEMMEMELAGFEPQDLIYSFKIEGREVTGLSWEGAKALARWMADRGHPMDAVEKDITDDEEAWYADVRVVDKETGLGLWGSSRQPKIKRLRSGEEKPDRFARTIAFNKAQRNGIRAHVPDKWIAQFIKQAIEAGKVRKVSPKEVDEKRRPRKKVPSKQAPSKEEEAVYDALEKAGLDPAPLNVYQYGKRLYVDVTGDLGDKMGLYQKALSELGAEWLSVGAYGRWEIPIPKEGAQ